MVCLSFVLCGTTTLFAQEGNISIKPYLADEVDVPERMRNMLQQKLLQIVTSNGYGSLSDQFILTANVGVLEKAAVPTVPPQVNLQIEVSVYVINTTEQIIVDEKSFVLSGIDKTETSAYTQALKRMNPRSPEVRAFMNAVRTKIVDYYAVRTPVLIAKARSLGEMKRTEEAILTLSAIPESVPEYPAVADLMAELYAEKVNAESSKTIIAAKAALATKDYDKALSSLAQVDPISDHFGEAERMIEEIRNSIDEAEREAKAEEMARLQQQIEISNQRHADEVMLRKAQIEASYKFAEEATKQLPQALSSLSWVAKLIGLK